MSTFNDYRFEYLYIDNVNYEILIIGKNGNSNILNNFFKTYPSVRCFIDKNILYFWDSSLLHDTVAKKLKLENIYNWYNSFVINKKEIESDIFDLIDEADSKEEVIDICKKYLPNYKKLKHFGIHLSKDYEKRLYSYAKGEINDMTFNESIKSNNNYTPELNDNFRWWFRDSKVVDANGQPLVCYHGSTVDIEEFDLRYSGNTTGNNQEEVFYFTSDKDTAITYAQEATVRENEWRFYDEDTGFEDWDDYAEHLRDEVFKDPKINPCYLRIENPYIFDADYTDFDYKRNYTLCSLLKGNQNIDYDLWDESLAEELYDVFTEYDEENDEYIEKNVSFDGIIIKNVKDNITELNQDYVDVYIVWDSRQIKSIYNKGIWDLNNPNVNEEFNTKTTGMGYYDDILNDPKYSEKKRKFGKTIKISPKTYIEACVEGFNTNADLGKVAERTTFEKLIESRRDKKLEEIKANFYKIDYDMPILHYEYRNDEYISFGQEGLHRAIAAMDLGEKEIPILLTVSLEYKADGGIEDADLKMFLSHMVKRLTKGDKMDEKLKKTVIKPKNVVLDDMEDETGMNTIAEEGASFAQLGTAPTPTAGQPTINGKPVQGKSVKKSKEKSKVSKLIEQFQKLI